MSDSKYNMVYEAFVYHIILSWLLFFILLAQ